MILLWDRSPMSTLNTCKTYDMNIITWIIFQTKGIADTQTYVLSRTPTLTKVAIQSDKHANKHAKPLVVPRTDSVNAGPLLWYEPLHAHIQAVWNFIPAPGIRWRAPHQLRTKYQFALHSKYFGKKARWCENLNSCSKMQIFWQFAASFAIFPLLPWLDIEQCSKPCPDEGWRFECDGGVKLEQVVPPNQIPQHPKYVLQHSKMVWSRVKTFLVAGSTQLPPPFCPPAPVLKPAMHQHTPLKPNSEAKIKLKHISHTNSYPSRCHGLSPPSWGGATQQTACQL